MMYICNTKIKEIITIKTLKIMANILKQFENQIGENIRKRNEVFVSCTILKETDKAINVMFIADCKETCKKYDMYTKRVYAWFPKSRTEVLGEHLIKTEGWLLCSKLIDAEVDPDEYRSSGWLDENRIIRNENILSGEAINN